MGESYGTVILITSSKREMSTPYPPSRLLFRLCHLFDLSHSSLSTFFKICYCYSTTITIAIALKIEN